MQKPLAALVIILAIFTGCSKQPGPVEDYKVIILMYHSITEGEPADLYERSIADFDSDLRYLIDNNIAVIGFGELEEMVNKGIRPLKNMAIITFDDGYHSCLTNAAPLLLKYDMEATFFLWVDQIGEDQFLSWNEINLMSHYTDEYGKRPFIFGSHTISHPFLLKMKAQFSNPWEYMAYLDNELGESKVLIESVIPGTVKVLALPYGNGAGNEEIISAAGRNGYSCIRTSRWNAIDTRDVDLFNLPSLPMLNESKPEIIGTYLGIEQ
jgi:peptidoglycan/xylan/chitin deacetylase (PgdA/CDA1 family)